MTTYQVSDKVLKEFHEKTKKLAQEHITKAYISGLRDGIEMATGNSTFQGIWQESQDKRWKEMNDDPK